MARSTPEPVAVDDTSTRIKVVWGLYIISLAVGLTAIVGVVLAYVWRGAAAGDPMRSHFDRQIRTFWIAVALFFGGLLLLIVGIGALLLLAAGIYIAVMGIVGLMKAFDGRPWPR